LFIDEGKCGLAFIPEDANDLKLKTIELFDNRSKLSELGENGFRYVESKFTRDKIANEFWEFILKNN
jgi:glycosyltransferase involved in cell wall biosynthesis